MCLSGSIYRVRATERLNRGGALRWRETRVIPGRLPRQEHPSPFLDSQFAPCKAPRPHILPPPLVVGHNLPARVSSCEAKGSQQPPCLEMFDLARLLLNTHAHRIFQHRSKQPRMQHVEEF